MTIGNPEPINPFGTHGGEKHTISVADRRRRADRWLGGRPDAQRAATSKWGCPRRRTAGAGRDPERQAEQVDGVIHPEEVDPAIEKPAPQARDPNVLPPPGTSGGAPSPQPK